MPTEQRAQYQRLGVSDVSDARKRIDNFMREYGGGQYANLDVICTLGVYGELNWSDLESVLADADRDRQFAEAVRASARDESTRNGGAINLRGDASPCFRNDILNAHQRIYGTPCTAKESK